MAREGARRNGCKGTYTLDDVIALLLVFDNSDGSNAGLRQGPHDLNQTGDCLGSSMEATERRQGRVIGSDIQETRNLSDYPSISRF
jgi:hypothetical protein